jgi:hypothetical protein
MPVQNLVLNDYEAQAVLMPGKAAKPVRAVRITIFGEHFPQRALMPEILVGDQSAQNVEISRDQRTIQGYLLKTPPDGATIRVRYGHSQEGELKERFAVGRMRALAQECQ